MYKIAIADDNKIHLGNLKQNVKTILGNKIQLLLEFCSISDIINYIEETGVTFDIFITDIDFDNEKVNGINLVQRIRKLSSTCQIIYVTSYLSFATEVYDTNHIYFLLKTDMKKRLPIAIEKAVNNIEESRDLKLSILQKGQNVIINQGDILYLERVQRITHIVLENTQLSCYETIEELLERMDKSIFIQCHKSYVVNLTKVSNHRKNELLLDSKTAIPISRSRQKIVNDTFMRYVGSLIENFK